MRKNTGFTLIELLVAITIVAILAALAFTSFQGAQKQARDTQRKSDLQQYKNALENYAIANGGKYPNNNCGSGGTGTCQGNSNTPGGLFSTTSPIFTTFLPALLKDPANDATYNYKYYEGGGSGYKLAVQLETGNWWEICSNGKTGLVLLSDFNGNSACDNMQ